MLTLLTQAADLLSDTGENPEYDKAIVELVCAQLGVTTDARSEVESLLRHVRSLALGRYVPIVHVG